MNEPQSPLSAVGVGKRFGRRPVLDDLRFELPAGQITVLLGRNGAGKSTLLRLCMGLLRPDAGFLRVLGRDPARHAAELRRRVGYVPDTPDAYDWMTPGDWFQFLAPHYPGFDRERALGLCLAMEVPARTPFRALSRGQATKAMLIGAVAHDPELLLLDEPFAGLDPVARDEILRAIIDEFRGGERTVLLTTHDLDVAARAADRVAILGGGRIVEECSTYELYDGAAGGDATARMRRELALAGEAD